VELDCLDAIELAEIAGLVRNVIGDGAGKASGGEITTAGSASRTMVSSKLGWRG
jgi:hypothetical protein